MTLMYMPFMLAQPSNAAYTKLLLGRTGLLRGSLIFGNISNLVITMGI